MPTRLLFSVLTAACLMSAVATQGQSAAVPSDKKPVPAVSPFQIDSAAILASYKTSSAWLNFRDASFSADGSSLAFNTDDGGRGGGIQGWTYDLRSNVLKSSAPQPFQTDLDIVGDYRLEDFRACHGCGETITALSAHNPPTDKSTVITSSLTDGGAASSDASAFVWGEPTSRSRFLIGLYVFATHRRRFVVLPSRGQPQAARPESGGYLVAYEAYGPCAPDATYLARIAEDQKFRESPHASNLCLIHVPAPSR